MVEKYAHVKLRKRELADGTFLALRGAKVVRNERFRPDPRYQEPGKPLPAVRAPARGRVLPQAARGARWPPSALALLQDRPVARDADAAVLEQLADEELERRPRAAARVEHPVDLPLGQERVVLLPRLGPVGELREAPELAGELAPCSTARSSRSSPTGMSNPASRSAFVSEPNVCQ